VAFGPGLNITNKIGPVQSGLQKPTASGDLNKDEFKGLLEAKLNGLANLKPNLPNSVGQLKFSNHAIDRMQARGISYSAEQIQKLQEAVSKAASKGAKQTLVLTDNSALIVGVKNNTVVTVMDKANLKENVFTNIDSTVMI
jgi:flagellar operon protein